MFNRLRNSIARWIAPPDTQVRAAELMRETRSMLASYDAARHSDEYKKYWANADAFDADSANSKGVRHTLLFRSRYEVTNNAYADGIAQTKVNDLVGVGPSLRMQSSSEGLNRMVELTWYLWAESVDLRRKLWTMGHAKHVDGEAFGIIRRNPGVDHPIKLDVQLVEAEMVQTPQLPFEDGYIDGIKFDRFGNTIWYDVLRQHPGSSNGLQLDFVPERVPVRNMLHWFNMRRPGQHRGVPEMVSSLNAGAAARRWREAVLSAAERAALLTLMMKTQLTPDTIFRSVAPFSTMDIEKGLMSFLPSGWEPFQADGKFPTATHEQFHKTLINEMGRAINMPRNKAAADSSDYNYASGRLDHGTYYDSLDIQRRDCDQRVLDRLFRVWFIEAVVTFGWFGGDPSIIGPVSSLHVWDWPKHRVADVEAEANANQTKLKSGQIFPHRLFSDAGMDWEDECEKAAESLGVDVPALKSRILDSMYPPIQQGGAPSTAAVDEAVAAMFRSYERRGLLNGKVNGHAQQ
jgi:capsid protein